MAFGCVFCWGSEESKGCLGSWMNGRRYFKDAPQQQRRHTQILAFAKVEAISQRSWGAVEISCLPLQNMGCPDVGSMSRYETDPNL